MLTEAKGLVKRTLETARTQSTYRRRLGVNVFAFLAGLNTVTQLTLWSIGSNGIAGVWLVALILVIFLGLVTVTARSLPPTHIKMTHTSYKASFEIVSGNVFDFADGPVVITANKHFDTDLKWVAKESLIRQLIAQRHGGNPAPIDSVLMELGIAGVERPVGEAVLIPDERGGAVLLAVASRHEENRSEVLVDDLINAESSLWNFARNHNLTSITVPIVGSGFARAQVGAVPLLMLLLTSYITASMEVPVCHLRVVLPVQMHSASFMELSREYARSLGFDG